MDKVNNIQIKKYITHVLDKNIGIPVLSSREQDLDIVITNFLEKKISKILSDQDIKNAIFLDDSKIKLMCEKIIIADFHEFNSITAEIALFLFEIIERDIEIPSGDLVCCLLLINDEMHLAFLKLNYRDSYSHFIDKDRIVQIIKNKATFPNDTQKVEECALINLKSFNIKLLEKKYTKNEDYIEYFSKKFLQSRAEKSSKEKVKIFNKVNDEFRQKYFNNPIGEDFKIKEAIIESIHNDNAVKFDEIAEKVFGENEDIKNNYINELKEKGIYDSPLIESTSIKKSFRTQKIKTDSGIEISLPFDIFNDKDKIEFTNNIDGTISIVLKNINKIINK